MPSKAIFVLLSQGFSSLSNFALVFLITRYGTLDELASLAVALLVFGMGTNLLRNGLFRRPIVQQSVSLAADASRASLLLVIPMVVVLGVMASVSASSGPMIVVALSLPVLYAHDGGRQTLLVEERYVRLVLMDAIWLAVFVFAVVVFDITVADNLVVAWSVGCVAGLLVAGRAAWPQATSWRRACFRVRNAWAELAEVGLLRGIPFVAVLLIARIVDYGEFGAWSSLRSFFGPLTVLYGALSSGGLLLLGSLNRERPQRLPAAAVALSATVALLAAGTALAISELFLPSGFGPAPVVAEEFSPFVAPVATFVGFAGLIQVARAFAHALDIAPADSLRVQARASVLGAIGLVCGVPWGMIGSAWGAVVGSLLGSGIWLRTAVPMIVNRAGQR